MTRPSGDPSYDVRVWSIRVYKGRRDTTYTVRWLVAGLRHQQTFATRKLAESFRAGLITASRGGVQFSESDGLPMSMRPKQAERTWYAHACAFIDLKWTRASPSHRRGLAEALVWVTTAMVADSRDERLGQTSAVTPGTRLTTAPFARPCSIGRSTSRPGVTVPSKRQTSQTNSLKRSHGSPDGHCRFATLRLPPRCVAPWTRSP